MILRTWRAGLLVFGETALLMGAVAASAYIRLGDYVWVALGDRAGVLRLMLIVGVCQVCLHFSDLYEIRTIKDSRDLMVRLFQAVGATSLILAVLYFWFPDWSIGRGVVLLAAVLAI